MGMIANEHMKRIPQITTDDIIGQEDKGVAAAHPVEAREEVVPTNRGNAMKTQSRYVAKNHVHILTVSPTIKGLERAWEKTETSLPFI